MEPPARSAPNGLESLQFHEEIHQLMVPPPENASSFTALLELPPSQAVELLHGQEQSTSAVSALPDSPPKPYFGSLGSNGHGVLAFPAANSTAMEVKDEPVAEESDFKPNVFSQPLDSDPMADNKGQTTTGKRKDREKKGKGSVKKSKTEISEDAEKLPYVHVRARRGQATDSHSLAERARREKINARMKLLQELVPGCSKISGTALVLDEIINHVQSLQRQVELLSMRLAAVNPQIDFNLENLFAAENASIMESNFHSMFIPLSWPEPEEAQANNESRQQHYQHQPWNFNSPHHNHQPVWVGSEEGNHHNFITPENSLLSYDSPANSVLSLHSKGAAAAAAENGIMKVE